jgi:hypothetical protein
MSKVVAPQIPKKVREVVTQTWQTEANLSVFLGLLILLIFVIPSLGLERSDEQLYANLATSVILVCGAAIAWRRRAVFFLASSVTAITLVARWAGFLSHSIPLGIWSHLTHHCIIADAFVHPAVAGLRPGAGDSPASPGSDSSLLAVWNCLGTCLRHRGLNHSRLFHHS